MNEVNDVIKNNMQEIRTRINRAAIKSGRNPQDIKLIAVTKTIKADRILQVLDEGIINLGENKVQELCEKYDIIDRECNWHLIGHLQTNKVKYIIDKVSLIHSVDSYELALEIHKRAKKINKVMEILVQVNVSGEATKYGISPGQTANFLKEISCLDNIKVKGLMTIAPHTENSEETRHVFKGLRKIFIDIIQEKINNIDICYLSMGMSNDFEVAIEEGANIIRIGTGIFGSRY